MRAIETFLRVFKPVYTAFEVVLYQIILECDIPAAREAAGTDGRSFEARMKELQGE